MATDTPGERRCERTSCNCDISSQSPSAFCCDLCEEQRDRQGRCQCGHPACGGIPDANIDKAVHAREGVAQQRFGPVPTGDTYDRGLHFCPQVLTSMEQT